MAEYFLRIFREQPDTCEIDASFDSPRRGPVLRRFIIAESEADVTSHAGFGLAGMALECFCRSCGGCRCGCAIASRCCVWGEKSEEKPGTDHGFDQKSGSEGQYCNSCTWRVSAVRTTADPSLRATSVQSWPQSAHRHRRPPLLQTEGRLAPRSDQSRTPRRCPLWRGQQTAVSNRSSPKEKRRRSAPTAWGAPVEAAPDWDALAQPQPELVFDQQVQW